MKFRLRNRRFRRRRRNIPYSRINDIPMGRGTDEITQGCLAIEGGGFRGLYNQGVLDALMEKGINFETVIGVSAGALAGVNYITGQIGRSARANLNYRHDSEFIGLKAFEMSRSPLNLDFLFNKFDEIEPLDKEKFDTCPRRYVAVASNCLTGQTEYFEKGKCEDILSAIKASASLPYMSPMVEVEGKPYLDGGCTCKIPYQWALDQGFKKIVIIKTKERGYKKSIKLKHRIADRMYRNFPELMEQLSQMDETYERECEEVDKLEKEGRVFVIAPSQVVSVGKLEPNVEKLGNLYWLGYKDALEEIDRLREYLERE